MASFGLRFATSWSTCTLGIEAESSRRLARHIELGSAFGIRRDLHGKAAGRPGEASRGRIWGTRVPTSLVSRIRLDFWYGRARRTVHSESERAESTV